MASPPRQPPSHSHPPPSPPPDNNPAPSPPSSPPPPPAPSSDHASPHPQPQPQTLPQTIPSPPISPSLLAVVLCSPNKPSGTPDGNPDSDNTTAEAAGAVTIGSLLATAELTVAGAAAANGGGSMAMRTVLAGNPWRFRVRKAEVRRLEMGLRVSALVLSVTALSLMAADTIPGWAGDSFVRYQEYRYLLSASAIAFLYSAFQFTSEVHQILTGRHFISRPLGYCFNLAMDQIMAYMLVSASSAATSQNDIWVSRFGGDNFTTLINASVSMSFLAFFSLASSSVISAHHLFSSIS